LASQNLEEKSYAKVGFLTGFIGTLNNSFRIRNRLEVGGKGSPRLIWVF